MLMRRKKGFTTSSQIYVGEESERYSQCVRASSVRVDHDEDSPSSVELCA